MNSLFIIFLTGLTTGGLSCLAVQGGLLASVIANQKEEELEDLEEDKEKKKAKKRARYLRKQKQQSKKSENAQISGIKSLLNIDDLDWMPVGMFLLGKLIAHTLLGFLLGALGSVISLSLGVRLGFQTFTALFMFGTAMNLLNVHPIFRYLSFQPPKFIQKLVRNTGKSKALFAPAILGLMTIFIPCGVTQAMEVLAINSGSPIMGALTMFSFVLGTIPLFAIIGVATAKLSETWHKQFTKFASYALVAMALYSINGVMLVMDSPLTFQKLTSPVTYFFSGERFANNSGVGGGVAGAGVKEVNGVQIATLNVLNSGYSPKYFQVKKGVPVDLTLQSNGAYSCALSFVFRSFGITASLDPVDSQTFRFTPTKTGRFTYTCSMGMYSGVMEVI